MNRDIGGKFIILANKTIILKTRYRKRNPKKMKLNIYRKLMLEEVAQ
jgi:hypothetical protein